MWNFHISAPVKKPVPNLNTQIPLASHQEHLKDEKFIIGKKKKIIIRLEVTFLFKYYVFFFIDIKKTYMAVEANTKDLIHLQKIHQLSCKSSPS